MDINTRQTFIEATRLLDWEDKNTLLSIQTESEAEKSDLIYKLSEKIYQDLMQKSIKNKELIAEIELTKGDINRLEEFNTLNDNIRLLNLLQKKYRLRGTAINVVSKALYNLSYNKKKLFTEAFMNRIDVVKNTYNYSCLALISSVSLINVTLTNFINNIDKDFKEYTKLDDHTLIKSLSRFNELCEKDGLDKITKALSKLNRSNFDGITFFAVATVTGFLIYNIVDILRDLVYYFLYIKASISDYFETNAIALELNANRLSRQDADIADEQRDIANTFRKIANKLKVEDKEAEAKSSKELKREKINNKYKITDISDTLPDSVAANNSAGGLF